MKNEALLLLLSLSAALSWTSVSVLDFGAIGDNATDSSAAFYAALAAVEEAGGGEVVVPAPGLFKTLPLNLTSNTRLTVDGQIWAIETTNATRWPVVGVVKTYASSFPATRFQPFIFAPGPDRTTNISIAGSGEINGAGPFWWCKPDGQGGCPNYDERRPHLASFHNVSRLEISGVTFRNSAFWTLRPVFCEDVYIHDATITTPWCGGDSPGGPGGPNTDGIDVDSSVNVLIERCDISVGDDHVTVLAGAGASGLLWALPSRNVTVRDNVLGTGMGLSVGSSVSGGVSDVLYTRNVMRERAQDWGLGAHISEWGAPARATAQAVAATPCRSPPSLPSRRDSCKLRGLHPQCRVHRQRLSPSDERSDPDRVSRPSPNPPRTPPRAHAASAHEP